MENIKIEIRKRHYNKNGEDNSSSGNDKFEDDLFN